MSDQQDSSSSDNGLEIVIDPPSVFNGAHADGSGTIRNSSTRDSSDNENESVEKEEENAPADVEPVSAAGENTPGTEGEKVVVETSAKEDAVITDEGEPSKYEPWLEVRQEQEMQVQMQEPPPVMPQRPPLQYQTPPLRRQFPPQHHQPSPQYHQPPPQHHQQSPQHHQHPQQGYPSRVSDLTVRAGPSWAAESDLDYLMRIRPPKGTPGRHDLGGDVSIACQLALLRPRRGPRNAYRYENQRTSRLAPYDPRYRGSTGMAALRSSRIIRHGNELESQPPLQTYPAHYNIQQYPAPERYYFIRHIIDLGITHENSQQTVTLRVESQYTPQSPPLVYSPSSPPKLVPISAPRNTPRYSSQYTPPRPGAAPAVLFDVPSTSYEPQQPLDLSVPPRDLPTLMPMWQSSSSHRAQARAPARATSSTQTVDSTTNTAVFNPYDHLPRLPLVTEESNLSTNRIELPASSSDHGLNRPTTHRVRTPEEQIYTWPEDNLDHTEEVETTDCDSWLESLRSLDRTPPEPSTLPPATSTSGLPPRTTSS